MGPEHGADGDDLARWPHHVAPSDVVAAELVRMGCLDYGNYDPADIARANALLVADPGLARSSIWAMAATGDAAALAAAFGADPNAVNRTGGPFRWPPLLYLTYSRITSPNPSHDAIEAARVLLDRGADPNAGYFWEGLVPPFTALAGAIGGGERREPPHPKWRALAEVLLSAGADANDGQVIYNRGLGDAPSDDTELLQLLRAHGFGTGDGGPWAAQLGDRLASPTDLVAEVLQHAAEHNLIDRVRLVLSWGADPNRRALHPCFAGRTPYMTAMRNGNTVVAELLARAGADTSGLDHVGRVIAHALAGVPGDSADDHAVAAAIGRDPAAIVRATELGRPASVRLMVQLGWDVNARDHRTALHAAAWQGDDELVDLLLGLGADPTMRDLTHDGTPAAWAHHGGHAELAARLDALG